MGLPRQNIGLFPRYDGGLALLGRHDQCVQGLQQVFALVRVLDLLDQARRCPSPPKQPKLPLK
ncbi:MAG: hypothetical protein HYZ81_05155 [Nitrospinae bacterium]|nr:hypothetical protein [Nitrospinota bacterium]